MKANFRIALLSVFILMLTSCARTIQFNKSVVAPGAEGKVSVKEDKNDNYSFNIKVSNLAKPGDLTPPKSLYMVWLDTQGSGIKQLGQLKSTNPLFTKALKASMKTVSNFRPTRIFITAEDNAQVEYPTGQEVLSTGTVLQ